MKRSRTSKGSAMSELVSYLLRGIENGCEAKESTWAEVVKGLEVNTIWSELSYLHKRRKYFEKLDWELSDLPLHDLPIKIQDKLPHPLQSPHVLLSPISCKDVSQWAPTAPPLRDDAHRPRLWHIRHCNSLRYPRLPLCLPASISSIPCLPRLRHRHTNHRTPARAYAEQIHRVCPPTGERKAY